MLSQFPWIQPMLGFRARGVIHVGAHVGDEQPTYERLGIQRQVWIEPHPESFHRLEKNIRPGPAVSLLNVACGSRPGKATMHELSGNDGASNSLLEPTRHLQEFPDMVPTGTVEIEVKPLDDAISGAGLRPEDYNLLVLDVQGFELEVLRGGETLLSRHVDAVISEISCVELYRGACLLPQVDAFMEQHGFERVLTQWMDTTWGDGLYLRRTPGLRLRRAVLGTLGTMAYRLRYLQNRLRRRLTDHHKNS
jgi:FkbM family methyltransferase